MKLIKIKQWEADGNDCSINREAALIKSEDDDYSVLITTNYSGGWWGEETDKHEQYSLTCHCDREALSEFEELTSV